MHRDCTIPKISVIVRNMKPKGVFFLFCFVLFFYNKSDNLMAKNNKAKH